MALASPELDTDASLDVTSNEWDWQPILQYRVLPSGAFLVRRIAISGEAEMVGVFMPGDTLEARYTF